MQLYTNYVLMMQLIDYIEFFSTFLPVVAGVIVFKKLHGILRLFLLFFLITVLVEIIVWYLSLHHKNNLWLINIYTLFEAILLLSLLTKIVSSNFKSKLFIVFEIIYTCYWIYINFILQSIFEYNTSDKFAKGALLIIASGMTLIDFTYNANEDLHKAPLFWLVGGIFFYFCLTLLIFSTANWVFDNSKPIMDLSWSVHGAVVVLANILFTIGFLCTSRKSNFSS